MNMQSEDFEIESDTLIEVYNELGAEPSLHLELFPATLSLITDLYIQAGITRQERPNAVYSDVDS